MKFKQELIENPVIVDNNTVQGTFQGKTIKVYRRQDGWIFRFCISIDGVLLHDDHALPEDKTAFEELLNRAWNIEQKVRNTKRKEFSPVIRELFGIK